VDADGEAGQELKRKIVDGVVAEVFKGLEGGGLAGAGESGEDDEFAGLGGRGGGRGGGSGFELRFCGFREWGFGWLRGFRFCFAGHGSC
jgi:hypothetical protein